MSKVLDPTKTTTIRRKFVADMKHRIILMKKSIEYAVVDIDALGLSMVNNQLDETTRNESDADKILLMAAFIESLAEEYYLDESRNPWFSEYTKLGYRRGVENAYVQLQRYGAAQETPKEYFIALIMGMAATQSFIDANNARILTDLRAYTLAVEQAVTSALADALQQKQTPRQFMFIVNQKIDSLSNKRALNIARTEVIRTHAEGQLNAYEAFGVEEVSGKSEYVRYLTAGDSRVCPICRPFEGRVMTIEKARGILPQHPRCRCSWSAVPPPNR